MIARPLTFDALSPAASSQRWRSRWWRVVQHAGALGFVLGYVLFVNSPALKSKLAMLDDYEILDFVSSDRLLSWSRVWHTFRADAFASTGRFLPVHYILRAAEMKLWGINAEAWHACRLVLALFSGAALYVALISFLRPAFAAGVAAALFSGAHTQVWVALGFTETYATAIALLAIAFVSHSIRSGRTRPAELFGGFVLLVVTGACKESFLPIPLAAAVVVYVLLPRLRAVEIVGPSRWRTLDWVATGLVALAYVTLLVGNVVHVQRYGHFYKGGFTFTSFADTLTFLLRQTSVDTAWPAALLGGAAMLAIVVRRSRREGADAVSRERRQIRASLLLLAGAFAVLVVPQCVIYGTTPVHYPRYLIPGNFFALLVIAWSGWVLQREPDRRWRGWPVSSCWASWWRRPSLRHAARAPSRHTSPSRPGNCTGRSRKCTDWRSNIPPAPSSFSRATPASSRSYRSASTSPWGRRDSHGSSCCCPCDARRLSPLESYMTQEVTRRSMQGTDGFRPISELAGYSGPMIHVMMQGAGGRDPQTSVTFDGPRL